MSENKTQPTNASVSEYLASVTPARRHDDSLVILDLMKRVTGWEPVMWGSSLIGFGTYNYKYESGREGTSFMTGFAPRKTASTIYIMPGFKSFETELAALGPHKHSVSCLYLTNLAKIDLDVLENIVQQSLAQMKEIYPNWAESQ